MKTTTLTASDLSTFATILVDALSARAGLANGAWWAARAAEHAPIGSDAEAFVPFVLRAANAAGRLLGVPYVEVDHETQHGDPDGFPGVRLSRSVRVF